MSTINDSDLLLVERNGNLHQITYDQMSTLNDDDILLVERGGVQYKVEAQYVSTGPNGVILPSVEVLTPLNGAGLNDGQSYTPMSSAYVSTDTSPIYRRYFAETVTTVSGGSWVNENNIHDGDNSTYAELTGAAGVVSQVIYTPVTGWAGYNYTVYAYATGGGTIEVLDDTDTVLRSYTLPGYASSVDVGLFRNDQRFRITTQSQNTSLFIGHLQGAPTDSIINGRVAFEFTDDTDLDKMVAPIIQTDANGDVKVPTTSTVDSTTVIPGANAWYDGDFGGRTTSRSKSSGITEYNRMLFAKRNTTGSTIVSDNVALYGQYIFTNKANTATSNGPELQANGTTVYPVNSDFNNNGDDTYFVEVGAAPKVLDIVTYTGENKSCTEVKHNLGTKPGMILVKAIVGTGWNWQIWHKDLPKGEILEFGTSGSYSSPTVFPNEPTKEAFYVGTASQVNTNGTTYVAYVFAADTPGKIKCGYYTGNGGSTQTTSVGFEGGLVIAKNMDGGSDWVMTTHWLNNNTYWPLNNTDAPKGTSGNTITTTSNGFQAQGSNGDLNMSGERYIYVVIAHDVVGTNSTQLNLLSSQDLEFFSAGTEITSNAAGSGSNVSFASWTFTGTSSPHYVSVDGNSYWYDIRLHTGNKWMTWTKSTSNSYKHFIWDSERSYSTWLEPNNTNTPQYDGDKYIIPQPQGRGFSLPNDTQLNSTSAQFVSWNFLAAPQFFDIQKYVGYQATGKVVEHDLGVEPGMIIIKNLSNFGNNWAVWHHATGNDMQWRLNQQNYPTSGGIYSDWCSNVTDKSFTLKAGGYSEYNSSNQAYMAYIFAKDTPYVKCGTYTGTGSGNNSIDIGFQPRWMLIKPINEYNDWWILDKKLPNKYMTANESYSEGSYTWSFTSTGVTMEVAGFPFDRPVNYMYVAIADESEGHPPNYPSTSTVLEDPNVNAGVLKVSSESFQTGATASAAALEASITSVAGSDGNKLLVDGSTGTWMPGLYAKGSETTFSAPGPDEITFTSQNQGTTAFSGVDATLSTRTWTLESGTTATGPWTLVDTYVDYDVLNSQTGATPWTSNKPNLTPNTFYRVKVQYNSTNAESVESVYHTFKTGDA